MALVREGIHDLDLTGLDIHEAIGWITGTDEKGAGGVMLLGPDRPQGGDMRCSEGDALHLA
ncbi:hypothetical protein [Methylorubrum thiocyanatum]